MVCLSEKTIVWADTMNRSLMIRFRLRKVEFFRLPKATYFLLSHCASVWITIIKVANRFYVQPVKLFGCTLNRRFISTTTSSSSFSGFFR